MKEQNNDKVCLSTHIPSYGILRKGAKLYLAGNWLYKVCGASDQQGQVICNMWISGFQAGMISSQNLAQVNKLKPASCVPSDLTADQAKLIIEKFLKDNPQYMQLSAALVASYALVIAFPCR